MIGGTCCKGERRSKTIAFSFGRSSCKDRCIQDVRVKRRKKSQLGFVQASYKEHIRTRRDDHTELMDKSRRAHIVHIGSAQWRSTHHGGHHVGHFEGALALLILAARSGSALAKTSKAVLMTFGYLTLNKLPATFLFFVERSTICPRYESLRTYAQEVT